MDESSNLRYFLICLALMLIMGTLMVFSSSYIYSKETFGSITFLLSKQIAAIGIGSILAYVAYRFRQSFLFKFGYQIHLFVGFLVLLTLVPGIGMSVKGASRWLNFGLLQYQPGEMIKYTVILASIPYFESFNSYNFKTAVIRGLGLLTPLLLILKQPDFGTFSICFAVIVFVAFMSSFNRKLFYGFAITGLMASLAFLFAEPYRVQRIITFLDPWKNPRGSGFQIIQSYLAFANGSIFGQGLGNSNEKLFYLPEAHNDFIFSVIAEELGFLGVLLVVLLFISFLYLGFRLCLRLEHRYMAILGASVVFIIGLQAFLNMGVVLGLLPTKGLNLPFFSYGGSSMISNLFGIGLFLGCFKTEAPRVTIPSPSEARPAASFRFSNL